MRRTTLAAMIVFTIALLSVSAVFGIQYITPSNGAEQSIGTSNLLFLNSSAARVGIGTNAPGYKLDVNGALNVPADTWITGNGVNLIRNSYFGYSSSYRVTQIGGTDSTTRAISIGADLSGVASSAFTGWEIVFPNNRAIVALNGTNGSYIGVLRVSPDNSILLGGGTYAVPGTIIINGTTNNVGIGTNAPGYKLDVSGTASISSTLTISSITDVSGFLLAGYTNTTSLQTNLGNVNGTAVQAGNNVSALNATGAIVARNLASRTIPNIAIMEGAINSTTLNLTANGSAGQILSLAANGQFTWIAAGGSANATTDTGSTYFVPYWSSTTNFARSVLELNNTGLYYNKTQFFINGGTGYTGVNTTAPSALFAVVGNVSADDLAEITTYSNITNLTYDYGALSLYNMYNGSNNGTYAAMRFYANNSANTKMQAGGILVLTNRSTNTNLYSDMVFQTSNGSDLRERMRLTTDGNLVVTVG